MGNLMSKQEPPKLTEQELKTLRETRQQYLDYLSSLPDKIKQDVDKKALSPETGTKIMTVIKQGSDWLSKNPNATLLEVQTNRDTTTQEIKRLLKVDKPIQRITNILAVLPVETQTLVIKKTIDEKQAKQINDAAVPLKTWFEKNKATANDIDFEQEQFNLMTRLKEINISDQARDELTKVITTSTEIPSSDLQTQVAKEKTLQDKAAAQQVDLQHGANVAMKTASAVFFAFLLIALCLSAGSVAANLAIGRPPIYRVLYFVYGCLPIYAPLVLLYAIYHRIAKGPLPIYAVLPISIEAATTRLGKVLWWPFYWVPDKDAIEALQAYKNSLEKVLDATG
jgi:hypothetical protein